MPQQPASTTRLHLSVLDQSVTRAGHGQAEAIRDTLALAEWCDGLGYRRFWLSEHHGLPTIAGSAPEVLLGAVAARTRHMRIGSAGVLLPHYSALKVAEQFRVLEALAPGRVDLGIGRAPGGDRAIAQALNPHASPMAEDFPDRLRDLRAWTTQAEHRGVAALPQVPGAPEIWVLGSSDYGAQLAARLGMPYAFAYFFTDGHGVEQALELYRHRYEPSERHPKPQATICVWALAADRAEDAWHHALSREHWRMARLRGDAGPLLPPDEIVARGFTDVDSGAVQQMRRKALVGDAAQVADKLGALAAELGLDELVVNSWSYDPAVRRHSYALLARQFGLAAPALADQNL